MTILPTRPWRAEYVGKAGGNNADRYLVIKDAEGRTILSVFGKPQEKQAIANFIVTAGNAHNDKI